MSPQKMSVSLASSYSFEDEEENVFRDIREVDYEKNNYSIIAVGSNSVSPDSFQLTSEKSGHSDNEFLEEEVTEDENEYYIGSKVLQKQVKTANLSFPQVSKHKIESRTTLANANHHVGGHDDDHNGDDILQQWRRRRRLEKLKSEQNKKELTFDEEERMSSVFAAMTTMASNESLVTSKPPPHHHHHHHTSKSSPQQQDPAVPNLKSYPPNHGAQQNSVSQEYQMSRELLKHPLKIHLCNISKCCQCCQSKSASKRAEIAPSLSKEVDVSRIGGGDAPCVHDPPTKDTSATRGGNRWRGRNQLQTAGVRRVNRGDVELSETKCRQSTERKLQSFPAGVMPENNSRNDRATVVTGEETRDESLDRQGFFDPHEQFSRRAVKRVQEEMTEFISKHGKKKGHYSPKSRHDKFPFEEGYEEGLHNLNNFLQDGEQLEFSFSSISSFKTDDGNLNDGKEVNRGSRDIGNSNPQNVKFSRRDAPVKSSNVNVFASGGREKNFPNDLERLGNETPTVSDIESLLEMSDGEEYRDDEILRGLREQRARCIRVIRNLNKMLLD